jgi:hypothetical protein
MSHLSRRRKRNYESNNRLPDLTPLIFIGGASKTSSLDVFSDELDQKLEK